MSFSKMSVADLRQVADMFGVTHAGVKTKKGLLDALSEEGVDYNQYAALTGLEAEEELAPVANVAPVGETVLLKMDRANPSYEISVNGRLFRFTKDHPFVPMVEGDAQTVIDTEEGFHIASPSEVKSYYA